MDNNHNLKELADMFGALDHETKLSILHLLSSEGSKSITDISKSLNINFSTAHKYLEELEKVGFVSSTVETHNRLKRMFSIKDFSINLSPKSIISSDTHNENKTFKIVTEAGQIELFDEKKFGGHYLEQGLPQGIVQSGMSSLKRQVYDGITISELRYLFSDYLKNNIRLLNHTLNSLEEENIHKRRFSSTLHLYQLNALSRHRTGDIFISNLRYPLLRNAVIDIRGLSLHGLRGKVAKNLGELFNQLSELMDSSLDDTLPTFCLTSFNYFIAPLIENVPQDINGCIEKFLKKLNQKGYNIYLELEMVGDNAPEFLKDLSTSYKIICKDAKKQAMDFAAFTKTAQKVTDIVYKLLVENKINSIIPIFKSWNWDGKGYDFGKLKNYYLANMSLHGRNKNSSFMGRLNRFDNSWKGWFGTRRVGEMQNITMNLPRIATHSKSTSDFMEKLQSIVEEIIEYQITMAELAVADFTRNHNVTRQSVQRVRWDYVRITNFLYSISIIGLNEAVYIQSGSDLKHNIDLGKSILKKITELIKKNNSNVRISLKEETNPLVADRFYYLDTKNSVSKVKKYNIGIGSKDWQVSAQLQPYLEGGHCTTVMKKNFDVPEALKSGVSLFRVIN